jgi:predicted RNA binding protein YcfA (HicA-like mRNA interferase family)
VENAYARCLKKKAGYKKRIHGSHYIYGKEKKEELITVPVHKNNDLKTGLLKSIMKIAEINESDL